MRSQNESVKASGELPFNREGIPSAISRGEKITAEYKANGTAVALIPAYRPSSVLAVLAQELASRREAVIVVNDGSGQVFDGIFDDLRTIPGVHVVAHAVNLGKGAALKTGFNYALTTFPGLKGVVTADADGQHHIDDIERIVNCLKRNPDRLILGVRQFSRSVPLRNRFGNTLTRLLVRLLMGKNISDTQTGLRGIPVVLMKDLLQVTSNGYEFELDMLISATHRCVPIHEEPIRTIYDHPGKVSHFDPIVDSMKIYFVLLRFGLVSLLTALLDNLVFFVVFYFTASIFGAQIVARTVAVLFNYGAARSAVFLSRERHAVIFPRYLALVVVNVAISYMLIAFIVTSFHSRVMWSKIGVEAFLFLANFAIQRDFVFTRRTNCDAPKATDWTKYYERVPPSAKLTRMYTTRNLIHAIQRFGDPLFPSVVEIGGANSCFLNQILRIVRPKRVDIVDTNGFGLDLLRKRLKPEAPVELHCQDCRTVSLPVQADTVFSVGLIEHFDEQSTREATIAHFRLLRPGGLFIVTFPTPTWLYRVTRTVCEMIGMWRFPDERPLKPQEVLPIVQEHGTVLFQKTLWPLLLTQHMIVARKRL